MLDLLLGAHSQITSLGEVHHLTAYATNNRNLYNPNHPLVCYCNKRVSDCDFWKNVENHIGTPLRKLKLRSPINTNIGLNHSTRPVVRFVLRLYRKIILDYPMIFDLDVVQKTTGYDQISSDYFRIYEAASIVNNTPYVVDSSKRPHHFRFLFSLFPDKIKLIVLTRNPYGVVYSKKKRNISIKNGAIGCVKNQKRIEKFSKGILKNKILKIRYEDLCTDTESVMRKICNFLSISFEKDMVILTRKNKHHIGGSSSKFDIIKKRIIIDNKYEQGLSHEEKRIINKITKNIRERWGYSEVNPPDCTKLKKDKRGI